MKFIKGIFSKAMGYEEISEYLMELTAESIEISNEDLNENRHPHKMLSSFTIFNSAHLSHKILINFPDCKDDIGRVFLELRLYFECLWQLILLNDYDNKDEAISKLAGESLQTTNYRLKSLFSKDKKIDRVFGISAGSEYERYLESAVDSYIFGERGEFFIESGDHIEDNITEVSSRIMKLSKTGGEDALLIPKMLHDATEKAPSMKLLKNIDLDSYQPLPDIFFK